MFDQECVPFAPSLIESMRSLGYSFSSAVADLIDNSISAGASKIDILSDPGMNPSLIILDNGCGMTSEELYEAMRYGSTNPLEKRDAGDLGRFGLGLKSASLSQCKKLVVISKVLDSVCAYSWDLDYVINTGKWMLKGFSREEILGYPHIEDLLAMESGTYVHLSDFDRIKEGTGNLAETFNKNLDDMVSHLSLVFHRFIDDDGLIIRLNNSTIKSRDPFLTDHPATQRKKEINLYIDGERIQLKPYILPHTSKLSQQDLDKVGGKERLRNDQGFYVYRNRRLIIWGTWFRLERKDELNKLARVRVDIPNTLDYMWAIDIKKSTATLPDIIKKNMYSAVFESISSSEAVHTHRGRKENKSKDIDYVWERIKVRDGYQYQINRNIPQLQMLTETLDDQQLRLVSSVLKLLEESFPVAALYVDAAKGAIEGIEAPEADETTEALWSELQVQLDYVRENKLALADYCKAFQKVEPYCSNEEIKKRLQEIIDHD